ncbi:sulfotransferase family 2 domain-containing protein [Primorskyibacter sp. 2E233]|uniref:sulfotransferase family 2 domain-containing protein n=1 Tax=Primorskyibacter sp. 2E233 TaxID=3413431 RepID=UPI003BF416D7
MDAYKLAYMPMPKAACSSVKEVLARLDPAVTVPDPERDGVFTWHRIYATKRFRMKRWIGLEDYFRFCVVRDPVKRLLSVYTNRVVQLRELHNSPRLRENPGHLVLDPDPDFFFQNIDAYRGKASTIKHHALPAHIFLGPDLDMYSRVYRVEDLTALAWDLSLWTRQDIAMPRSNQSDIRLTLDDLQDKTIDALRPFLDAEYSFLSGFYENPLGARYHRACAIPERRVS